MLSAPESRNMSQRILVLDVPLAGQIQKYMFDELERLGWTFERVPIHIPDRYRYTFMATTIRWPRSAWSRAFYDRLATFMKSPECFLARTRLCERAIRNHGSKADVFFQIGGLFAPSLEPLDKPYVTFNDYTTKLAQRHYPQWTQFRSSHDAEEWFRLERNVYENASRVFAASENTRRSVIEDYGTDPNRVIVVGEGMNFQSFPVGTNEDYSRRTILFIGKDFERKGGFVLLDAFRKVKSIMPDVQLIIAGQQLVKEAVDGVTWIGWLANRQAITDLYRRSSLFVMPSLCEPFGLVFLEAMAHGLPCIGSRTDAMPEIIDDGQTGLLAKVGDSADLAEKIMTLLGDPLLMEEMGLRGREKVKKRYTWNKIAGTIDQELKKVLAGGA